MCKKSFNKIEKFEDDKLIDTINVEEKKLEGEEMVLEEYDIEGADDYCYACNGTNNTELMLVCDYCNHKCCHIAC